MSSILNTNKLLILQGSYLTYVRIWRNFFELNFNLLPSFEVRHTQQSFHKHFESLFTDHLNEKVMFQHDLWASDGEFQIWNDLQKTYKNVREICFEESFQNIVFLHIFFRNNDSKLIIRQLIRVSFVSLLYIQKTNLYMS